MPVSPSRGLRQRLWERSPFVPRAVYLGLSRAHHQLALEKRHIEHVYSGWVPPGHFYSPFPDLADFDDRVDRILAVDGDPPALDLGEERQLALFDELAQFLTDVPFPENRGDEYRYYFDNPAYAWGDGLMLHAMLRHVRPRRVVEVGSGYSSAMILDTTERWLDPGVEITFVEPYDELLRSLLRKGDGDRVTILDTAVQDVDMSVFTSLKAGDVLFIDSTHVVKAGSDVNHLYFEVLPALAPGVVIHVHDIFYPFEYPASWVREGRAWQESYLLHAFLMYNASFEITWFQHLMWLRHSADLAGKVPEIARNVGGNIWLRKVA